MPNFSPAADAVLDAFENASDGEYVEGVWVVNERTMLAAALRAAADRLGFRDELHGRIVSVTDLLAIANELESQ